MIFYMEDRKEKYFRTPAISLDPKILGQATKRSTTPQRQCVQIKHYSERNKHPATSRVNGQKDYIFSKMTKKSP